MPMHCGGRVFRTRLLAHGSRTDFTRGARPLAEGRASGRGRPRAAVRLYLEYNTYIMSRLHTTYGRLD